MIAVIWWSEDVFRGETFRRGSMKLLASALMLMLYLWLQALAVSSTLHHAVHQDASASNHHCVVTLVSQGQVCHSCPLDSVPLPAVTFLEVSYFELSPVIAVRYILLPGRAPPILLT
ncbi:MAG: hypothetical protein JWM16_5892 [Verrucomicrobiales bacterium]|nr:hypothetical protein [Verrucomicrobiales bacterium]